MFMFSFLDSQIMAAPFPMHTISALPSAFTSSAKFTVMITISKCMVMQDCLLYNVHNCDSMVSKIVKYETLVIQ